jgi:O-antigen/teichoic acid export membrane protein
MINDSSETPKNGLGQRTFVGSVWLLGLRVVQQGISLIQVTLLARLLSPEDFGLMGIALLAVQAIGVLVYTGYEFALIQEPDLKQEQIDTAWWVILARRLFIGACLVVLAVPIARLYEAPEAIPVLIAMALIQPLLGLTSPSLILFRRELEFRTVVEISLVSALAGLAVGVSSAFLLRNVWSLFLAILVSALTTLGLSYLRHPYRPRWRFSRDSLRKLSGYGRWMLGSAVLWFVYSQGSNVVSGWLFGVAALGLYQMASRFALLPSTQLGDVIQSATFPAFAEIQHDQERVSRAYVRTTSLAAMVIIGMTVLTALGLPRLFVLILGEQWTEAAPLIPVIAFAAGLRALLRTGSPLYLGTGRPRIQFFLDLAQSTIMLATLYPLARLFGLVGLAYAMLFGSLSAVPIWYWGVRRATHCGFRDLGGMILPAVLGAGVASLILFVGRLPFTSEAGWLLEVAWQMVLIGIAALGYLGVIAVFQRAFPNYSPLAELHRFWRNLLLRLRPALSSSRGT